MENEMTDTQPQTTTEIHIKGRGTLNLLPCPFCGMSHFLVGKKFIECAECGAQSGYEEDYEDIVNIENRWNARSL